jgi:hypothetical protein
MSHLTRRRFSRRKAIHNDHPRTRKAQEKDWEFIFDRQPPTTSGAHLSMSQRCVPAATPRHAELAYCAAQHLLRHGTLRIRAVWNDPQGLDWAVQPHCGTMRFLGASKRPLHPPGAASQSNECIEADWLGTRLSSSPPTQIRDHGIHACEVPATRRTEDLIELTSQVESSKTIEAVKTEQIQNN